MKSHDTCASKVARDAGFNTVLSQGQRHIFVPAERKIPKIRIETRQAERLSNQRIIVAIDSWARTSRYPQVGLASQYSLDQKLGLSYTQCIFKVARIPPFVFHLSCSTCGSCV